MYYYLLYGQVTRSEVKIQEADDITVDKDTVIDLDIMYGMPPEWVMEQHSEENFEYLTYDVMWVYIKDVGIFYLENGKEIRIWKEREELTDREICTYLMTSMMGLMLIQKKLIPIHGSALSYNGKAVIISGCSGSGKSTTALSLLEKGLKFVADDVSAVRRVGNGYNIFPGPPWQKVKRDVYEASDNPEEFEYINEFRDKFARRLPKGSYISEQIPVGCMFVVCAENVDEVELCEVTGVSKLHYITNNLYRGRVYHVSGINTERMQMFLDAAASIPIYVLSRPRGKDTIEESIEKIYSKILQIC